MPKFFDTYKEVGGNFVKEAEKKELIRAAVTFPVLDVVFAEGTQYGDQYFLKTELEGEDRVFAFTKGSVESRDRMLRALQDYLATADSDEEFETPFVKLVKKGRSILIRDAASEEESDSE